MDSKEMKDFAAAYKTISDNCETSEDFAALLRATHAIVPEPQIKELCQFLLKAK